jgi:hypothetical protein
MERAAEALTWGADEHVLIVAAAVGWLLTRKSGEPVRRLSTHVLVCSLATAILPHVLKAFIQQERPDRRTIGGVCTENLDSDVVMMKSAKDRI